MLIPITNANSPEQHSLWFCVLCVLFAIRSPLFRIKAALRNAQENERSKHEAAAAAARRGVSVCQSISRCDCSPGSRESPRRSTGERQSVIWWERTTGGRRRGERPVHTSSRNAAQSPAWSCDQCGGGGDRSSVDHVHDRHDGSVEALGAHRPTHRGVVQRRRLSRSAPEHARV